MAKKTTEIVLLFHKKTTRLVFLWPNIIQKNIKELTCNFEYFWIIGWNVNRNWRSSLLGVWNSRNFLFLPSFIFYFYLNCSIVSHRALRFITSCSSCVWLFCLSIGGLGGIAISLLRVIHQWVNSFFLA